MTEASSPPTVRSAALPMLAGLGLLVGCWALLPPYTGPPLNTADMVEFVDHVVPGVVVIALSLGSFLVGRSGRASAVLFPAGLGIVLAGFWMTATHLPLVLQATRAQAPWGATVYHSLPGLAVLVLGVAWALTYRSPAPESADPK
ncbi:MAG: hypothetical protein M3535_11820 [Actinomycetota bacterium]|nr:hypothetical protein [Actinomycetota bacterium]